MSKHFRKHKNKPIVNKENNSDKRDKKVERIIILVIVLVALIGLFIGYNMFSEFVE